MYNADLLLTGFEGLFGFNQNQDPNAWQLTEMLASSSGLWIDKLNPLLSLENLQSVAPEYDIILDDPSAANVNAAFTAWLKGHVNAGIIEGIEAWKTAKFQDATIKNLLTRKRLFDSPGNFADLEETSNKRVGFEIIPARSASLVTKIIKVGFQFSGAENFQLFLFRVGEKDSIEAIEIDYTSTDSLVWFDLNWELKGTEKYYIVYSQEDIQGSVINGVKQYDFFNRGLTQFPTGRYYAATAMSIDNTSSSLWDLKKNEYTVSTNYGMNLQMNVCCDYTDFLIEQRDLFKTVCLYSVGMNLLNVLAMNSSARVNKHISNLSRAEKKYEIEGNNSKKKDGLKEKLANAIEGAMIDTSNVDSICLPCLSTGIYYGAI